MHKDGKQIVGTTVEARGGFLGRPVLLVLIVGLLPANGRTHRYVFRHVKFSTRS